MKIRTDFVTNSSSSSFILVFDKEKDKHQFVDCCDTCDYQKFLQLLQAFVNDYIVFYNYSDKFMPISFFYDKLFDENQLGSCLPQHTKDTMLNLVNKHHQIKPNDSISLLINEYLPNPKNDLDKLIDAIDDNDDYLSNKIEFCDVLSDDFKKLSIDDEDYSITVFEGVSNRNKEKALEDFYNFTIADYKITLLDKYVQHEPNEPFIDFIHRRDEFEKSEFYLNLINEYLQTTDYEKKKKRIEESFLVVQGTIWDSNGGILEWAIRNGFIEDNFRQYCLKVFNVG